LIVSLPGALPAIAQQAQDQSSPQRPGTVQNLGNLPF